MISELHQKLRIASASAHKRLESTSIFSAYFSTELTKDQLNQILFQQYISYDRWQLQLTQFEKKHSLPTEFSVLLGVNELTKSLDKKLPHKEIDEPPSLTLKSVEDYLGCAYVFEGSKLGNRVIGKKLKKNTNITANQLIFFDAMSHSSSNGEKWVNWMVLLNQFVKVKNLDEDKLCQSAVSCFEVMENWFAKPLTE
jgi:heme oxygenase